MNRAGRARLLLSLAPLVSVALPGSLPLCAQQAAPISSPAARPAIGTVALVDATVTGDLSVNGSRAVLIGSSGVLAKDHTAEVTLERGGSVRVCATSGLHLTQSQGSAAQQAEAQTVSTQPHHTPLLLLALDRGAIEIHDQAIAGDVLITPDLRFAPRTAGPLDLSVRVTPNGDTCVDNHGNSAPVLALTDQFGSDSYEVLPNQHVLFERGSLREVVDHESSPCGCPGSTPMPQPGISIAEALLAPGTPAKVPATQAAAAQHPFPAAVSQGLAPTPPVPQATPGAPQVLTTLGYAGNGTGTIDGTPVPATPPAPVKSAKTVPVSPPAQQEQQPTPPKPKSKGITRRVGRFFKRLFGAG